MRYVKHLNEILLISPSKAAPWALCLSLSLFSSACSLRILGIDKNSDSLSGGTSIGESSGNENGIHAFSVLGASGGSDAAADAYLTDGTALTAEWVDTTGEDAYEVSVLDEGGNTTLCGPVSLPADTSSHTFTGCALAHGASYRIQVIAKNSQSGSSRSSQGSFQVGPFLTIGQVTTDEWGIASAPVTLSYAVASPVTVQYVTVDGSAQAGTDYTQLPLTTLTFPAGQTSATIHVPISKDVSDESDEDFRIELTTPSGAAIQTSSAEVLIQDGNLPASTEFASLSSFGGHTCAITSSGGAKCWGSGTTGQLGDNTSNDRSVPTSVTGLSSGITQIASGGGHTCSLSSGGAVKCWGLNSFGQVGDNSVAIRQAPVDVFGLASGISQVAVGGYHSCAVTTAGAALCWGYNGFGQLGDNTAFNRSIPTGVFNLSSGVTQITAGDNHSCALLSTGAVKCWGFNGGGQLGDNSTNFSMIPVDVVGLASGVDQIVAGGTHTCALMGTGAVKCWGSNSTGQIGDNSTIDRVIPTDVSSLSSGVTQLSAGSAHTCALLSTGEVKCWGGNSYGQLGDNSTTPRLVPTSPIGVSSGIIQVAAFSIHSCALYSTGAVQCWGSSANGRLGDNTIQSLHQPLSVSGLGLGNTQIEVGSHHSCALTSAGGIKCWGYNSKGQIGDNSTVNRLSATDGVGLTSGVTQIAGGANHTCALTTAGAVKCWGDNFVGELGDNTNVNKSVPTDTLTLSSGVTQIVGGSNHTCALTTAGGVKCWGGNTTGQIGDNTLTARWVPTDVLGLTAGVSQITAGAGFTCALTTAGAVMCWGQNTYGQIGDNSTTTRRVPTQVFGLTSGITQIDAGGGHVCALSSSGAVSCWGGNSYGQLGDNTVVAKSVPVPVPGLSSGMAQISSGNGHTCALSASGGLKCWGYNVHGQIGNSDFSVNDYRVPTDVFGLSSGVSQVSAGYDHTCYLVSRIGAVQCFGRNNYYQLGNTSEGGVPRSVVAAP